MPRVMILHVKKVGETQRFRRHMKTAMVEENGKKVRKTVWGYELVGKKKVDRPELADCSHGPGDIVVSSYGRRYVVTDEGSLRMAEI
jgi:hypothetical protein